MFSDECDKRHCLGLTAVPRRFPAEDEHCADDKVADNAYQLREST